MRIISFILLIFSLWSFSSKADSLSELWERYSSLSESNLQAKIQEDCPGHIVSYSDSFTYNWKYRSSTYELHYTEQKTLSKSIYSLALYSKDISKDLSKEKFYSGVAGFHYTVEQISDWVNSVLKGFSQVNYDENRFINTLIKDNVIIFNDGKFIPSLKIKHVLGAAPGKKSILADNLLHERLHVFWDNDADFKQHYLSRWNKMASKEQEDIKKEFKNYNQDNINQIIEEWAINEAQKGNFNIE